MRSANNISHSSNIVQHNTITESWYTASLLLIRFFLTKATRILPKKTTYVKIIFILLHMTKFLQLTDICMGKGVLYLTSDLIRTFTFLICFPIIHQSGFVKDPHTQSTPVPPRSTQEMSAYFCEGNRGPNICHQKQRHVHEFHLCSTEKTVSHADWGWVNHHRIYYFIYLKWIIPLCLRWIWPIYLMVKSHKHFMPISLTV